MCDLPRDHQNNGASGGLDFNRTDSIIWALKYVFFNWYKIVLCLNTVSMILVITRFFYFQVDKQEFKHSNQLKPYFKSS